MGFAGFDAALVGVGQTPLGRFPKRSNMSLAAEAFRQALDDAGLRREDVDGLVINQGFPLGVDYDEFAVAMGLDIRYVNQSWTHGRFTGTMLHSAALAVTSGMADCVACVTVAGFGKLVQVGGSDRAEDGRPGGASHGERPEYGMTAPVAGCAIATRRYFQRYGVGSEDLAHVGVTFRRHASLNPMAMRREPISVEDHQNSRYIVEPLRLLDCCQVSDGGAVVLVTRSDRARGLRKPPVKILSAQGIRSSRDEFIFGPPRNGIEQQRVGDMRPTDKDLTVFALAGLTPSDVDAFYTYDAFSPLVWFALERFGHCAPGEAPEFVKSGGIGLQGRLPANTNGGLLSEGHLSGWNMIVELVRQFRGECGERQLKKLEIAQWATAFGDSLLFGRLN
jgi:acetyl-CoA acetyltransferase